MKSVKCREDHHEECKIEACMCYCHYVMEA